MDSKRLETLYKEYKKIKGYADGTGQVSSNDPSYLEQLKNSITKSLEGPKFEIKTEPTPVPEDKATKIRRENSERAQGTRPALLSDDPEHRNDYNQGGVVKKYTDGGLVDTGDDTSQDDTLDSTSSNKKSKNKTLKMNLKAAVPVQGYYSNPNMNYDPSAPVAATQSTVGAPNNQSSTTNPLSGMTPIAPAPGTLPGVGGTAAGGATIAGPDPTKSNGWDLTTGQPMTNPKPITAYKGGVIKKYADGTSDVGSNDTNDELQKELAEASRVENIDEQQEQPVSASKLESQYVPEEDEAEKVVDKVKASPSKKTPVKTKESDEEDLKASEKDAEDKYKDSDDTDEDSKISSKVAQDQSDNDLEDKYQGEEQKAESSTPDEDEQSGTALSRMVGQLKPQDSSNMMAELKNAQAERRRALMGQQGAQAGALLAAGIAGHGAQPVSPSYFQNKALAEEPVISFQEQLNLQKNDPNSDMSKAAQKLLVTQLGMRPEDVKGSPYAVLEKFIPQSYKQSFLQNQFANKQKTVETTQANKLKYLKAQQDFNSMQKDLDRQTNLQGHKMMADAIGSRASISGINTAVNSIESDPLIKTLRINKGTLDLSLHMLDNPDIPVNPQMINDAANGFTQAMSLRPGSITQKRYDATKINTLKNDLQKFIAYNADNPNVDMRQKDPALFNTLHDYLSTLQSEYNDKYEFERNRLYKQKIQGMQAGGAGNVAAGLSAAQTAGKIDNTSTPQKTVVKKGYNADTNQTQFVYSDGTKEIKDGKL